MSDIINRQQADKVKRLRRLYSLGDFRLARSATDFLADCDPTATYSKEELSRFRCYETTAIVAYTRPFSDSKGEIPPLTLEMTSAKLNKEQNALHGSLIKLRNQVFAYSDVEMMRMVSKSYPMTITSDFEFTFLQAVFAEGLTFIGPELLSLQELLRIVHNGLYASLIEEAQRHPEHFNLRQDYLAK
jgi:hypothetical protein